MGEDLIVAVKAKAEEREGRMTLRCADAFALAEQFGVERIEIGRICNQHNIKMVQCQLGCFK